MFACCWGCRLQVSALRGAPLRTNKSLGRWCHSLLQNPSLLLGGLPSPGVARIPSLLGQPRFNGALRTLRLQTSALQWAADPDGIPTPRALAHVEQERTWLLGAQVAPVHDMLRATIAYCSAQ